MLPSSNTEFFTLSQSISQLQYCTAIFESKLCIRYAYPGASGRASRQHCHNISQEICQAPAGRLRPEVLQCLRRENPRFEGEAVGEGPWFSGDSLARRAEYHPMTTANTCLKFGRWGRFRGA